MIDFKDIAFIIPFLCPSAETVASSRFDKKYDVAN
jgi:hypothetical protein